VPGIGQSGEDFLSEGFAGALFGPGQPFDALRYFLLLPDGPSREKSGNPVPIHTRIFLTTLPRRRFTCGIAWSLNTLGSITCAWWSATRGAAFRLDYVATTFVDARVLIDRLASPAPLLAPGTYHAAEKTEYR
jgi:hypothetical protein